MPEGLILIIGCGLAMVILSVGYVTGWYKGYREGRIDGRCDENCKMGQASREIKKSIANIEKELAAAIHWKS